MLTALGNGVQGGKWFSLIDKVCALRTLEAAWKKVAKNRGAAGVGLERQDPSADEAHAR
jgi:RNA-directed DNA polymerase